MATAHTLGCDRRHRAHARCNGAAAEADRRAAAVALPEARPAKGFWSELVVIALVLQIAWLVAFGLYMVVSGSLSDDAAFAIGVLVGIPLVGAEFLIGPLLVVALLGGSAAALHKMATANGRKR